MDTFLSCNNKLPEPLSNEELNSLFIRMYGGDLEAREKIIKHNARLIVGIINRKSYIKNNFEDLFSVGMIGLIKATDTFKLDKNTRFSSYATICIKNELLQYYKRHNKELRHELDYQLVKEDDDSTDIVETISDNNDDFVSDYEKRDSYKIIYSIIDKLPYREKIIVCGQFELNGIKKMSLVELGKLFGISKQRVSILLQKSLKIIRKELINLNAFEEEVNIKNLKK